MTPPPTPPAPRWSTSSFGAAADTSPLELSVLRAHLDLCSSLNRRWFRMQCAAEAVHRFVAGRLVTTLVGVTLFIVLAGWLS